MAPEESAPAALARRMIGETLRVRAGENVLVETWNHTLTYAAACVQEARQRGAHGLLLLEDESTFWETMDGDGRSVRGSGPGAPELAAIARADAYVLFPGPADKPRLHALPRTILAARERHEDDRLAAIRRARLRATRCALGDASEPQAAFWGVSTTTWRGQLLKGALEADLASIVRDGRRSAEILRRGREVRLTSANGTDLRFRLRSRPPIVDDGLVGPDDRANQHLLTGTPPGSVVVAIDESSAEGLLIGSRPSFLSSGRADGGQWEVHGGRVTNAWFTEGRFEESFAAAPPGKDVVGLFSVGLNPALAPGTPQVEDQEAGAVTLGIGGNRRFGGRVGCPFLAWIVVGEATVAVDGRPLLDRGKFL